MVVGAVQEVAGSVLVLLGLVAALFGFKYGDALAAIGVAGFIGFAGLRLGRQTVDTLLDAAPEGMSERIASLAASVPGVVEIDAIRLRTSGAESFGDITVVVSRTLPLDRAKAIKAQVVSAVQAEYPRTSLTVMVVPRALDSETVLDRIMLTAAKRRLPVHHVTVQTIGERLSIGLDVEVDGRMSLAGAHTLASKFESALREELGAGTEVETHIEPLRIAHLAGQEASPAVAAAMTGLIDAIAAKIGTIHDIHDVRVRDTGTGLVIIYHCRADASLNVETVHACLDALEQELRTRHAGIIRAIGHAEPR